MELKMNPADIRWWFWFVTLLGIVAALAGWPVGYDLVMAVSALHVLFFAVQERSLVAFPVQVRIVYFGITLFGLWPQARPFVYAILLVGTVMVTFFDRCLIARVLKGMPWNSGVELKLN